MKAGDVRVGVDGEGIYLLIDSRLIGSVYWRVLILESNSNIEEDDYLTDDIVESWLEDYTEEIG